MTKVSLKQVIHVTLWDQNTTWNTIQFGEVTISPVPPVYKPVPPHTTSLGLVPVSPHHCLLVSNLT